MLLLSLPLDKKNISFDCVKNTAKASTNGGVKQFLLFLNNCYMFRINTGSPLRTANMIYISMLILPIPIAGSGRVHVPARSFFSRRTWKALCNREN